MKKELIIAATTLLLLTAPAYANQGHNDNASHADDNHGSVVSEEHKQTPQVTNNTPVPPVSEQENDEAVSLTPTDTPTPTGSVLGAETTPTPTCDPNASWKSHGEFVSCVAREHLGGKTVSDAGKSDIGKKHHDEDNDHDNDDDDISPTMTPSVSPSVTPSDTPTGTPVTSAAGDVHLTLNPFEIFRNALAHLLQSLPFFHHHEA